MSDFRLRVFSSVAKNLSFTKASQELFISQPAITKHIQELETMYQTRLFERMGNKILLTDAGRLLLEHCEKILEDYGRLEYEMNLLRNEHTGELRGQCKKLRGKFINCYLCLQIHSLWS